MSVDLTSATRGDKFEAIDGRIWEYVNRIAGNHVMRHYLKHTSGAGSAFTDWGGYTSGGSTEHDLLRPVEKPEIVGLNEIAFGVALGDLKGFLSQDDSLRYAFYKAIKTYLRNVP